jgi:molybdopterin synthase catalytic subunit
MQVHILPFGVLKDLLGSSRSTVEFDTGSTVADLLDHLARGHSGLLLRGIAVSVNAEYALATQVLRDGDEVGLLPPVSGGSPDAPPESDSHPGVYTALTRQVIDAEALIAAAKGPESGAAVVFDGIVRNHSRGRQTLYLDYEAYETMAAKQIHSLSSEAIQRFGVRHVTLIHRLGRLRIGETSVLIVVASPHRAQAFDACRWLIDTLKKTVPIWKKETFVDGAVWADGEPFPKGLSVPAPEADRAS